MTEIEERFYKVFGIEKFCTHTIMNPEKCNYRRMTRCCDCDWHKYPEITNDILLELIQLLMTNEGIKIYPFVVAHNGKDEIKGYNINCEDYFYNEYDEDEELEPISVYKETLKDCILEAIILVEENYKGYLYNQVHALFSEVEE